MSQCIRFSLPSRAKEGDLVSFNISSGRVHVRIGDTKSDKVVLVMQTDREEWDTHVSEFRINDSYFHRPLDLSVTGPPLPSLSPRSLFEEASTLWEEGRAGEAQRKLFQSASLGDEEATFLACRMYEVGEWGAKEDANVARMLVMLGAETAIQEAREGKRVHPSLVVCLRTAAYFLLFGMGGCEDSDTAFRFFVLAASLGDAMASMGVGVLLSRGDKVNKENTERAMKYFREGAGIAEAYNDYAKRVKKWGKRRPSLTDVKEDGFFRMLNVNFVAFVLEEEDKRAASLLYEATAIMGSEEAKLHLVRMEAERGRVARAAVLLEEVEKKRGVDGEEGRAEVIVHLLVTASKKWIIADRIGPLSSSLLSLMEEGKWKKAASLVAEVIQKRRRGAEKREKKDAVRLLRKMRPFLPKKCELEGECRCLEREVSVLPNRPPKLGMEKEDREEETALSILHSLILSETEEETKANLEAAKIHCLHLPFSETEISHAKKRIDKLEKERLEATEATGATEAEERELTLEISEVEGSTLERDSEVVERAEEKFEGGKDAKLCVVCIDSDVTHAIVPCGHLCCCGKCAEAMKECPICRGEKTAAIKIFSVGA